MTTTWCCTTDHCTEFYVTPDWLCQHCHEGRSLHVVDKCVWDSEYFHHIDCIVCRSHVCVCSWSNLCVITTTNRGVIHAAHTWCRQVIRVHLYKLDEKSLLPDALTDWILSNPEEAYRVWTSGRRDD